MTDKMNPTTLAAAAALEAALNSVENAEAVELASMLIMLSAGFLRAVCGDEYTRGFLEEGIRDIDKPAIMKVVQIRKSQTQH